MMLGLGCFWDCSTKFWRTIPNGLAEMVATSYWVAVSDPKHKNTFNRRVGVVQFMLHFAVLHFAVLDFAVLDFAVLDFAMLDLAVLDFAVLHFAVLHFAMLHFAVLHFAVLHFAVLDFAVLDFAVLDFAVLHFAVLLSAVLHFAVLHFAVLHLLIWIMGHLRKNKCYWISKTIFQRMDAEADGQIDATMCSFIIPWLIDSCFHISIYVFAQLSCLIKYILKLVASNQFINSNKDGTSKSHCNVPWDFTPHAALLHSQLFWWTLWCLGRRRSPFVIEPRPLVRL